MALRLAKDLKSKSSTGFGLTFSEGITYDLDELISGKNRADSERGLIIEVKKSQELAEKAIAALKADITTSVTSTLQNEDVQAGVMKIISEIFNKFSYEHNLNVYDKDIDIPEAIKDNLNYSINEYLKGLYTKYKIAFTVTVEGKNTVKIDYDFTDNTLLYESFSHFYDKYSDELVDLSTVNEGGLAISDSVSSKVRVSQVDYNKYLLDDGPNYGKPTTPNKTLSPYKVKVNWEDGTEDNTTSDQVYTVYDEIEILRDTITALQGGVIENPELDSLKEISKRLEILERVPILMEDIDNEY